MFALLDCNNFFVSCEKVFRPDLEKKPVVVLSNNDGCIVAMSKELKAQNILRGVPYFKVKDELEKLHTVVFSSNYTLYQSLSNRIMNMLHALSPEAEVYSIDEAFLHLDGISDPLEFCRDVKQKVEQGVGVPISIGLGRSKTLAKIAIEFAKKPDLLPDDVNLSSAQCMCMTKEVEDVLLKALPVGDVWGIGRKTAAALAVYKIVNAKDFRDYSELFIQQRFGLSAWKIQQEIRATRQFDIHHETPQRKGIISSCAFSRPVRHKEELYRSLAAYANNAMYKLHKQHAAAHNFMFYIKSKHQHSQFGVQYRNFSRAYSFALASAHLPDFLPLIRLGLDEIYQDSLSYAKAGVALSGIEYVGRGQQIDLFDPHDEKKEKMVEMQTFMQAKYGRESFGVLPAIAKRDWDMRRAHLSPHYTTKWKDLPHAHAK